MCIFEYLLRVRCPACRERREGKAPRVSRVGTSVSQAGESLLPPCDVTALSPRAPWPGRGLSVGLWLGAFGQGRASLRTDGVSVCVFQPKPPGPCAVTSKVWLMRHMGAKSFQCSFYFVSFRLPARWTHRSPDRPNRFPCSRCPRSATRGPYGFTCSGWRLQMRGSRTSYSVGSLHWARAVSRGTELFFSLVFMTCFLRGGPERRDHARARPRGRTGA